MLKNKKNDKKKLIRLHPCSRAWESQELGWTSRTASWSAEYSNQKSRWAVAPKLEPSCPFGLASSCGGQAALLRFARAGCSQLPGHATYAPSIHHLCARPTTLGRVRCAGGARTRVDASRASAHAKSKAACSAAPLRRFGLTLAPPPASAGNG